jgi:hypothetical protein
MSECSNCARWRRLADYPTMGDCLANGGNTAAGYVCNHHEPAAVAPVKAERKPRQIDIAAAADRVMDAGLPRIDIISVQALIKCQYRQAAEIIELLKEQGRIR